MELSAFCARHQAALEENEAKHNLMLGLLGRAVKFPDMRFWSLGEGAACALQTPPWNIVMGDLTKEECQILAEKVRALDFPGMVGPEQTSEWLAEALSQYGQKFRLAVPQGISSLTEAPVFPRAKGNARRATFGDQEFLISGFAAFQREAIPEEKPLTREQILMRMENRTTFLWEVGGQPVAMAMESRESRSGSVISAVYTIPEERGKGYGGSVVASLSEWIFQKGKKFVALYTDLRNPISNRVYEKIGFKRIAEASHFIREGKAPLHSTN